MLFWYWNKFIIWASFGIEMKFLLTLGTMTSFAIVIVIVAQYIVFYSILTLLFNKVPRAIYLQNYCNVFIASISIQSTHYHELFQHAIYFLALRKRL